MIQESASRRSFLEAAAAGTLATAMSPAASAAHANAAPVKVAQVGTKHAHARSKMATMRKYPELFDIVGVAEADSRRRIEVQDLPAYRGLRWMTEEQILAADDIVAVTVETDIDNLLPTAERCIEAGRHIHLDKPAGTSLDHFRRICESADRKGLMIQMGYMYRNNPAFRFAYEAVRKGWLGDIFQVHCEMSKKVNAETRVKLAKYAGGSMFELGCHLVDATVTVLGIPQHVSSFLRNTQPEQDQLMDTCLAVFEYPKAMATIRSSLCEVEGFQRRQFVVCGSKGTVVIRPLQPFRLSLTLEDSVDGFSRGTHDVELPAPSGPYDGDLKHFAAVVQGQVSAEYDTAHDLAVQEALLQACGMAVNPQSRKNQPSPRHSR